MFGLNICCRELFNFISPRDFQGDQKQDKLSEIATRFPACDV